MINWCKGEDVFIVGGGPSLHGFDFGKLTGKGKIIGINNSYMYVKCDIVVFLDSGFRAAVKERGHELEDIAPRIIAGAQSAAQASSTISIVHMAAEVSKDPSRLYGSHQSGLPAINAALIGGAARIFLLGFDFRFHGGRGHFFSDEWKHHSDNNEESYRRPMPYYAKYARYKNIYNCSQISACDYFQKVDLDLAMKVRNQWMIDHWKGQDVFIVGGGPSLYGFDFSRLNNKNTIAVNNSYMYFSPKWLMFGDQIFLDYVRRRGHNLKELADRVIALDRVALDIEDNIFQISGTAARPTENPDNLYNGVPEQGSIACLGINAAMIAGAGRIFLLGIDCRFDSQGRGHFYSEEWKHPRDGEEDAYTKMVVSFSAFKNDKRIYNCSPISRIDVFQRITLDEALNGL